MISYVDDFKLMMIVTLCAIPLALLLRKPVAAPAAGAPAARIWIDQTPAEPNWSARGGIRGGG